MLQVIKYPSKENWNSILKRPTLESKNLEDIVSMVLGDIRQNGDSAIRKYTQLFDKVNINDFVVQTFEFQEAEKQCSDELKKAIQTAKANIETFHASQRKEINVIETMSGIYCWQKSVAIEKVGLYIPGGTAPLFSTILMLAVPAKIAGCQEIILCTPPDKNGNVHPAILYTAQLTGITKVFKVGGVQAIGAMAYGTETIPATYKIFGPGNQYVTCAKQLINKQGIAIDMPAGPSEVLVIADETSVPEFVASDLLSQAEHGIDSQVILLTTSELLIEKVQSEIVTQLNQLPRKEIAEAALKNSKIILLNTLNEAIELSNEYAPEHLILSCQNADSLADKVINAGSVFIGNYSPESVGDYASGTNHTLPTNGFAKSYSGVSLDTFMKKITFQKITKEGLQNIGNTIEIMAAAEQLDAHKNAVTVRLRNLPD